MSPSVSMMALMLCIVARTALLESLLDRFTVRACGGLLDLHLPRRTPVESFTVVKSLRINGYTRSYRPSCRRHVEEE